MLRPRTLGRICATCAAADCAFLGYDVEDVAPRGTLCRGEPAAINREIEHQVRAEVCTARPGRGGDRASRPAAARQGSAADRLTLGNVSRRSSTGRLRTLVAIHDQAVRSRFSALGRGCARGRDRGQGHRRRRPHHASVPRCAPPSSPPLREWHLPSRRRPSRRPAAARLRRGRPSSGRRPAARPDAVAQIDALAQAKAARTPTELKVDSRLLAAEKQVRGLAVAAGVGQGATPVSASTRRGAPTSRSRQGHASAVAAGDRRSAASSATYRPAAGTLLADVPRRRGDEGRGPAGCHARAVADGSDDGQREPAAARSRRRPAPSSCASDFQAAVAKAGPGKKAAAMVGSVDQSRATSRTARDVVRANRHIAGAGVTVGVLSDGVDSLAASIASGDLPADTQVLPGQAGDGDEGTAMLEIVHDLAPTADLAFATASTRRWTASRRTSARCARPAPTSSWTTSSTSPSPRSRTARSPRRSSTSPPTARCTSARPATSRTSTTSTAGNYEGDFKSSRADDRQVRRLRARLRARAPASRCSTRSARTPVGVPALLQWADPLGHSGERLRPVRRGRERQRRSRSPTTCRTATTTRSRASSCPAGTAGLAVVKFSGADRYFQLTPFRGPVRGRQRASRPTARRASPAGTRRCRPRTASPPCRPHDAVPARDRARRPEPVRSVPGPVHHGRSSPRRSPRTGRGGCSSSPDGTPITPGNFTLDRWRAARASRTSPRRTGCRPRSPASRRSSGRRRPHRTPPRSRRWCSAGTPASRRPRCAHAISSTALDIEQHGWDRDTGYGIMMANRLLNRTGGDRPAAGAPPASPW